MCKENACPHTQYTFTEKEPEECVPGVIFSGGTGSWKAFTLRAKLYFTIFYNECALAVRNENKIKPKATKAVMVTHNKEAILSAPRSTSEGSQQRS